MTDRYVRPHPTVRTYSTFSSDIDLTDVVPGREHARAIYVTNAGSGTLAVEYEDGHQATYTGVGVGYLEPRPALYTRILAATNVGSVRVGF